jgi:uncharacterized membrane protein YheB (UPF0754 family)
LTTRLIIIPILGAFIGWSTNVLAIKLIFWPYEPVKIPLTKWQVHGVIPKRRREIAANIGQVVEEQLFSIDDFISYLEAAETKDSLLNSTLEAVLNTIVKKMPHYIPGYIKDILANIFEEKIKKELPAMLDNLSISIGQEIRQKINLSKIIEDRINEFEIRDLERLILQVSSKELNYIKIMGGVVGFFIGLVQAGLAAVIM